MRFYGFCLLLLAVVLVLLPLGRVSLESSKSPNPPAVLAVDKAEAKEELPSRTPSQEEEVPLEPPPEEALPALAWTVEPLRVRSLSSGEVESLSLEDFALGALCSEMPATFEPEALKAQAISARTWALYQRRLRELSGGDGPDFEADPENWKGYVTREQAEERFGQKFEEYWAALSQAAEATKGQILCYQGEPIAAAYHAISAGQTEDARYVWGQALPYLQAVESRGDELAPGYEGESAFSWEAFCQALSLPEEAQPTVEVLARSPSGYVTQILVGERELSGQELRSALGLRSSCFTLSQDEEGLCFRTQGYGHGVGLSQYGADFMARQGSDCQEILAHYYPGAQLCQLS